MTKSKGVLAALLIAGAAFTLDPRRLDLAPPSLHPDETTLIQQAQSIARTGRDVDGHVLPLYFHLHDNVWIQPVPVYFTALFLATVGLSQSMLCLPSVVVAAIDVALLYAVAMRLFDGRRLAILAAALLALTPVHFISGRLALANVYPAAFVLGWLLCLLTFIHDRTPVRLFAATLCLGVGFYSHPAAVLTMPLYVVLTLLTVRAVESERSLYAVAVAGFVVPLVILVPWFYAHYDVFRFTLGDWGLHTLANPRDGLRYSVLNWPALASRSSVYWAFFSPSYLFFTGGADLVSSTRQSGVFLGLIAIPLLCGVYQIVQAHWSDPRWRLILWTFLLAPVAAATFRDSKAAGRAVAMAPLGALIAAAGFDYLLRHRRSALRLAGVGVLLLLPIQFYRFYDDYFTRYPQRAAVVFGQGAARE